MSAAQDLELESLETAIHTALAAWDESAGADETLLSSLLVVQGVRDEQGDSHSAVALRRAINRVLEGAIDELGENDETGAAVLRARFVEGEITRRVAYQLHASPDQVNRWQKRAIRNLAEILWSRETALRRTRVRRLEATLPPPTYTRLFGFEHAQKLLVERLVNPDAFWIVAVTGIGGVGKTSLADALTRQAIRSLTFDDVVWLRAGSQSLSGEPVPPEQQYEFLLTDLAERLWQQGTAGQPVEQTETRVLRALAARPYLVVVDNLETEEEAAYLLDRIGAGLGTQTAPTKFVLTARARPATTASVFYYSLEELPRSDAAELLRHHAEATGLEEVAKAPESDVEAIYQVTGGNPLALKLVVSLAAVLPLPQILADLSHGRPGPIEELYKHIYWQAWRTLSEEGKALLQAMPLAAGSGARPEQMQAMSGLSDDSFWAALRELTARSLLEVRGTTQERRYGIHRLTETFLQTEIIHWPEEPGQE